MARVSGVDIPREKRVEVALTYVFGIGRTLSQLTLAETGIDPNTRVRDLSEEQLVAIREYVDANIPNRDTQWSIQMCGDGEEERPCIDPMFTVQTRFDWIRDLNIAAGDPNWPNMAEDQLAEKCGQYAMNVTAGGARTKFYANPVTTGFITHKLEESKPLPIGDVYWLFDPYRFNENDIQKAIRWVLGEHFQLDIAP